MKANCNENHWWDVGYITIEHWGEGEKEKKIQKNSGIRMFQQCPIFHFTLKKPRNCR